MKALMILWMSIQSTVFPLSSGFERIPECDAKDAIASVVSPIYTPLSVVCQTNPVAMKWVEVELGHWEDIVEASFGPQRLAAPYYLYDDVQYVDVTEQYLDAPVKQVDFEPAKR